MIQEEKANAKDLHPKLLGGMFFFFALGATGGITSLLTSDKPIFERYLELMHARLPTKSQSISRDDFRASTISFLIVNNQVLDCKQ